MASYNPLSGVWAYDAAKAGVLSLTMGAASEFALNVGRGRQGVWPRPETIEIGDAGHMLHFEAPIELAGAIESFFNKHL